MPKCLSNAPEYYEYCQQHVFILTDGKVSFFASDLNFCFSSDAFEC